MHIASIVLGVAALLLSILGIFLTVIPIAGTLVSFAAPVCAIVGIVLGGLGMSRAKREGAPSGAATAGMIVSIVALVPALLVAVTCGLCNACVTAGTFAPRPDGSVYADFDYDYDIHDPSADAGSLGPPDPTLVGPPPAPPPADPDAPPTDAELASVVWHMNDLCGDTWCEGEFDYRFDTLTCASDTCTLTFEAEHYQTTTRQQHTLEVTGFDRILECNSFEGSAGAERCTGRGPTDSFTDALNAALSRWEDEHR